MNKYLSNILSDKIDDDTNIIWFEKSNKYIVLNDLTEKLLLNKIDPALYPLAEDFIIENSKISESLELIDKDLENLLLECNSDNSSEFKEKTNLNRELSAYSSNFKFNDRTVKIEYGSENLKNLIYPKFEHLNTNDKENIKFKITEKDKKIYFHIEDLFIGAWGISEMHEFQGKVSMELTSFFHNKDDSDWVSVFHGSTLCKKNNTVMLTGDSGNGKSSLSTILMYNGFSLIADDFSPLDNRGYHYNFPSAISIKEGFYSVAKDLTNKFNDLKEYYINEIKGNVKYLPANSENELVLSSKCNEVINVTFGRDLKNEILEINKGLAIQKVLPDAWISNNKEHADLFIEWIKSSNFYNLTYNDNERALDMINKIF